MDYLLLGHLLSRGGVLIASAAAKPVLNRLLTAATSTSTAHPQAQLKNTSDQRASLRIVQVNVAYMLLRFVAAPESPQNFSGSSRPAPKTEVETRYHPTCAVSL